MENIKSYFNINYIILLIIGILSCITIIGAIVGVPLIIGANAFKKATNYNETQLKENSNTLMIWSIVCGILTLPIGIIVIILGITACNEIAKLNSNVIYSDESNSQGKSMVDSFKDAFGFKSEADQIKEKLEGLEKLKNDGVITEEEYQQKRKQMFGL